MPILHELLAAGQRIPKDSDNSPEKKTKIVAQRNLWHIPIRWRHTACLQRRWVQAHRSAERSYWTSTLSSAQVWRCRNCCWVVWMLRGQWRRTGTMTGVLGQFLPTRTMYIASRTRRQTM